MSLAIYDMDRTITRSATYAPWLIFWARTQAPWRLALVPLAALFAVAYKVGLMSRGRLKERNQRLLMGDDVPRADVARVAAAFGAQVTLMPGAVAQIAADRAEGRTLVMATASYAFYAEAIAARLGFDAVIATRSVWSGDRLRARIDGDNCYGDAKRAMVAAWLPANPGHIRAYSDHFSDAPLFDIADEAVATTPSAALRALATTRGWRIVDWRPMPPAQAVA